MRLAEFFHPTACYYHGSNIGNLKTLRVRPSSLVNATVVFAAILPEIAVAMSGHWSDDDFSFGHSVKAKQEEIVFKPYTMREKRPGMFQKYFSQPLYLYEVPANYFETTRNLQDFEVVSRTDVPVHSLLKILEPLKYLEGSPFLHLHKIVR